MPYNKLLNDIIEKSGLKQIEIVNKCKAMNVKITPSYLSVLRKEDRIPSDDVSRAIAKVCNAEDENILVIEAYIDKAPETIVKALEAIKYQTYLAGLYQWKNDFSPEAIEVFKATIKQQSFAQIILELSKTEIDYENKFTTIKTTDENGFKAELTESIGHEIKDNSMYPILKEGNKVKLLLLPIEQYKDGDIICYKAKEGEKLIYRKCTFTKDDNTEFIAIPLDSKYRTEIISLDDVIVLGKVVECISTFE